MITRRSRPRCALWRLLARPRTGRSQTRGSQARLGPATRQNAGLRLFNAPGWHDFATPFFGAVYSLKRPGIPQERITWKNYDAGHRMYVRDEDRAKLSADVRAFLRAR